MTFPNLEPNHEVRPDPLGYEVWCPFEKTADGILHLRDEPVTSTAIWAQEADPSEVECPVCAVLNGKLHYLGSPDCVDDDATD